MVKQSKYQRHNLLPALRLAAEMRNKMHEAGFTDNGGAIHSAERILNILGQRLKYPQLSHLNNLKRMAGAEFSEAALETYENGGSVKIEHVHPHREFTRSVLSLVEQKWDDEKIIEHVKNEYRLVLLTETETIELNKINRIKMDKNRMAGIKFVTMAQST
jgi:hypothetical protein